MSTVYTLPSRSNLHFEFLTFGHSGTQAEHQSARMVEIKCRLDLDGKV